ncbi:MAG: AMP-binding protein, partial [Akkermansiaceae bacterium]|nr:AMP-binding protein [Akkermansiaceae bacterium]
MCPPQSHTSPAVRPEASAACGHWLDAFTFHATRNPEGTALVAGAQRCSYRELNERSQALASELRSRNIGKGDHVGAGFHRSIDLIVALLGIIKSGAAYVPLDPGYPEARISQMIDSARIKSVITSSSLSAVFPQVEVIAIESIKTEASIHDFNIYGSDPVYAIFTSGSTG